MISFTKLLSEANYYGDELRYHKNVKGASHGTSHGRGPIVVWNCTKTCNLNCIHCYSNSDCRQYQGEMTTEEGKQFIDNLADFKVPVLLFSGGEPLIRKDIYELISYTRKRNIRATVSTNGTLITKEVAQTLKDLAVSYVGISLDGIGESNDRFRGRQGAFDQALNGIRNCLAVGQKVGLRFTINRHTFADVENIFRLVEDENIPRVCFYHLAYSGRASGMMDQNLTNEETREVVELIASKVEQYRKSGLDKEILTVDNHCDGIYLYLREKKKNPKRAQAILELLQINGGNRTGIAIGAVDWYGNVHPDQFTQDIILGNVKDEPFSEIWNEASHPILAGLRDRKDLLKGNCQNCNWLDVCNGNFRARAKAYYNDYWAADPGCYLKDEERDEVR